MSEAEFTRSAVLHAADEAEEAKVWVDVQLDQTLTEIQSNLNQTRKSVETAQRQLLSTIPKVRTARADSESIVLGATGLVANAINLFNEADSDLTDAVVKFQRMREQLDEIQANILTIVRRDQQQTSGKLQSAVGYLRGYASTL